MSDTAPAWLSQLTELRKAGWKWVVGHDEAGYFVRAWKEVRGQPEDLRCPLCRTRFSRPSTLTPPGQPPRYYDVRTEAATSLPEAVDKLVRHLNIAPATSHK